MISIWDSEECLFLHGCKNQQHSQLLFQPQDSISLPRSTHKHEFHYWIVLMALFINTYQIFSIGEHMCASEYCLVEHNLTFRLRKSSVLSHSENESSVNVLSPYSQLFPWLGKSIHSTGQSCKRILFIIYPSVIIFFSGLLIPWFFPTGF